jgi:uncharacterized RDD family membrane protein YckC
METVQCMECRGMFPADDVIRHSNAYVCAGCKPIFMQRLAEGTLRTGQLRYAGFWRRFVAILLDGILLGIVNLVLQIIVIATIAGLFESAQDIGAVLAVYGIQIATAVIYETVLIGKYGSTPGKMALQLEVVTAAGGPVSYGLAFGRYFAKWLSYLTLLIGFIIAAFDPEKRALHDRLCNTRVVIK